MTDGLQVVSAGLLVADVGADGSISGGTGEVLAVSEGDVLTLGVLVALGETEIDDVYVVLCALVSTNEEIIWLDVSMNDPLFVDFLNTVDLKVVKDNTENH